VAEPVAPRAALARGLGAETVDDAGSLERGVFDVVVDAAGYAGSLSHALALGAAGAHVVLLGLGARPEQLTPLDFVERRLTLTGSNAFVDELPAAIELLATEGPRYAPVVTDTVPLDELPALVERQLRRPDAMKVLVHP
jgi:threonine dehydrogenase-like Zn-dependent dehydrogenase